MLDGRMWWVLRQAGAPEKRKVTKRQVDAQRAWLAEKIAASKAP